MGRAVIRDLEPVDRAYSARIDRAANRAAMHAAKQHELHSAFTRAAFDCPSALVSTPGKSVTARPVSYLIAEYLDDADLALLLRDAAKGEDVQLRATLILSKLARQFASDQADYSMEVEDL